MAACSVATASNKAPSAASLGRVGVAGPARVGRGHGALPAGGQRHGVGRRARRGDRPEQPGAVAGQRRRAAWRRCRPTPAARRSTSSTVGRCVAGASADVVVASWSRLAVGAAWPATRTISSDSASACAARSAATSVSAPRPSRGAAAAASVARSLSVRARSSCGRRSSRSGGGGAVPHATESPPYARAAPGAAAPTSTPSPADGRRGGSARQHPAIAAAAPRRPSSVSGRGQRPVFASWPAGAGVSWRVGSADVMLTNSREPCPDNSR